MTQKLRCADCGDLTEQGSGHECWVRRKLNEGTGTRVWTDCIRCGEPQINGVAHWRCWQQYRCE